MAAFVMTLNREYQFITETLTSPNSIQTFPTSASTSTPKPTLSVCLVCGKECGRKQEMKRHLLSLHLPNWICCPHSRCPWRGHRIEDLRSHLKTHQKRRVKLSRGQYIIYDKNLVLDLILEDKEPFETVIGYALDFVYERALERNMVREWEDLLGRVADNAGRRSNQRQRRDRV
jgi:hypothetical protein